MRLLQLHKPGTLGEMRSELFLHSGQSEEVFHLIISRMQAETLIAFFSQRTMMQYIVVRLINGIEGEHRLWMSKIICCQRERKREDARALHHRRRGEKLWSECERS